MDRPRRPEPLAPPRLHAGKKLYRLTAQARTVPRQPAAIREQLGSGLPLAQAGEPAIQRARCAALTQLPKRDAASQPHASVPGQRAARAMKDGRGLYGFGWTSRLTELHLSLMSALVWWEPPPCPGRGAWRFPQGRSCPTCDTRAACSKQQFSRVPRPIAMALYMPPPPFCSSVIVFLQVPLHCTRSAGSVFTTAAAPSIPPATNIPRRPNYSKIKLRPQQPAAGARLALAPAALVSQPAAPASSPARRWARAGVLARAPHPARSSRPQASAQCVGLTSSRAAGELTQHHGISPARVGRPHLGRPTGGSRPETRRQTRARPPPSPSPPAAAASLRPASAPCAAGLKATA